MGDSLLDPRTLLRQMGVASFNGHIRAVHVQHRGDALQGFEPLLVTDGQVPPESPHTQVSGRSSF